MSSTSFRQRCARTVAPGLLLLSTLAPAQGQEQPAPMILPPAVPPELSLPPAPLLQLTPPAMLAPLPAVEPPHAPWLSYWREASVPREWRDAPDSELRLRLETGDLELDDWSLSTGLRTTPEREREQECYPNCLGADWASSVILKYDAGSIGPLEQAGPMLELEGKPSPSGARDRGLFKIGLIGSF